ncbi:hypothetical protein CKO51_08350 [Rhodopirellula sp. SM50]|nr:hypothetical protein CKO51_08350 [Rhodopirellula sp. SM50]
MAKRIESDDPEAVSSLMQLWYHALVRRNDDRSATHQEQTVSVPAAKNGKPKKSSKEKASRKVLR